MAKIPQDNWDRFIGDSDEPEWDLEADSDEVDFDKMNDIDII